MELRTTILTWADRLAPEPNAMRRDTAIASGRLPITYQDAKSALTRMAHNPSMTRLSDQQLSTWRAEATANLLQAVSARQSTRHAQRQLHPITEELERRAHLTPHERAAEDAVRRAEEAERMAGGDPGRLAPRGVLGRIKAPAARPADELRHQHQPGHQYPQQPGRQM